MDGQLWNDIISTSLGGAAGGAVAGLVLYGVQCAHVALRDRRDSKRIYKWMLLQRGPEHKWSYRSTRTIASYTNLTEDRVRYLCSHHPRITLSTGREEDMWSLEEQLVRMLESDPN
ncbi:hypothetical protein [Pseudomonas sp. UBA6310]|uniref:hypothetical protein n=1 Tax=Pseudomonas sp. UBA6310 TaxID=1947327 RepID=UPI00257AEC0C|nr:hypothetical protein [Pseudomonas sp. UBA6310]